MQAIRTVCARMCVCLHKCLYPSICVCVPLWLLGCMCLHQSICVCVHAYVCVSVCTHPHTHAQCHSALVQTGVMVHKGPDFFPYQE